MKIFAVLMLLAIVGSLFSGLFFFYRTVAPASGPCAP